MKSNFHPQHLLSAFRQESEPGRKQLVRAILAEVCKEIDADLGDFDNLVVYCLRLRNDPKRAPLAEAARMCVRAIETSSPIDPGFFAMIVQTLCLPALDQVNETKQRLREMSKAGADERRIYSADQQEDWRCLYQEKYSNHSKLHAARLIASAQGLPVSAVQAIRKKL